MVKKLQKLSAEKKSSNSFAESVKESAQQIWLAGLGAFSKAQEERGKVFDTLVKEGLSIQRKTQAAAEEKISEATSKMAGMASGFTAKASGLSTIANGQWDKLENIFEERVAKALNKLGVPTSKEVATLVARIDELNKTVQKLGQGKTSAAPKSAATKATTAKPVAPQDAAPKKAVAKAPSKAPAKPKSATKSSPKAAAVPVAKPAAKSLAKRAVARKAPPAQVPTPAPDVIAAAA